MLKAAEERKLLMQNGIKKFDKNGLIKSKTLDKKETRGSIITDSPFDTKLSSKRKTLLSIFDLFEFKKATKIF